MAKEQTTYWLRYPASATLAAAALGLAACWFLYLPLCYALAVALRDALFPWVTWYHHYFDAVDDHFLTLVWLPLPALLVLTVALLRRLAAWRIAAWRPRPDRQVRRVWRLAARSVCGLALLVSGGPLALMLLADLLFYAPELSVAAARGAVDHGARCGSCHSASIPLSHRRLPELWRPVITRMRDRRGVKLSDGEVDRIDAYLQLSGSYSDRQLFLAKCRRCHLSVGSTPRTAEEWRMIIDRVARISPFAYPRDWRKQLARYARKELAAPGDTKDLRARERFGLACGYCHDLDRTRQLQGRAARPVIQRMAGKVAGHISASQVDDLARYIQRLPKDDSAFDALFPHDRPEAK